MNLEERKAAVNAYKERKVESGVFAIRCTRSQQVWVGSAPDVSTIQNRHWFALRQGQSSNASLQELWNSVGEDAFTFEVVAILEPEESAYVRNRLLKESVDRWIDELQGTRL